MISKTSLLLTLLANLVHTYNIQFDTGLYLENQQAILAKQEAEAAEAQRVTDEQKQAEANAILQNTDSFNHKFLYEGTCEPLCYIIKNGRPQSQMYRTNSKENSADNYNRIGHLGAKCTCEKDSKQYSCEKFRDAMPQPEGNYLTPDQTGKWRCLQL